ncbi:uncharacterized protein [Setaria viridis]|uniref:uncharacterized protein n=1 Tax=Setaria viridis TaxID=4556 RepID=UPI001493DAC9|nr:uncharacterized protein LOC117849266 [Setaria viridis]
MVARGYKILSEKYYVATGLKHDSSQLRNRSHQLKKKYEFWKGLQKETGLGRNPGGTVFAPNWWWEQHTKGRLDLRKLQNGAPEYLDQLEEMFHDVVVDGSTSFIP